MPLFNKPKKTLFAKPTKAAPSHQHLPESDFATTEDTRGDSTDAPVGQDSDARFLHGEVRALVSSNVAMAQYDRHHRILRVTFHDGKTYPYQGVSHEVALGLIHASSPGSYVHEHLKGKFPTQ